MKTVQIFSDAEAMAKEIAYNWHEQAKRAAESQLVFSVVLSGGSTAPALYGKLAEPEWRDRIPWKSVHIFFADERCVAPISDESNYKIIYDHLFRHISIPKENIHRIRGEENPDKEALRYGKDIIGHQALRKGSINFFDWVLLGIGTDGHTASLFPGQNISNLTQLCNVTQHPDTGQNRITMTHSALKKSARITYHVIGEKKSKIVSELISNPSPKIIYPASQIKGELFLDKHAASKIDIKKLEGN
ncbi:MAG: 6-phosphogluconolactonase [Nitrospinae bacterium]|nr:6-phosphogluconolactonase [Nitrospinota bacterium]